MRGGTTMAVSPVLPLQDPSAGAVQCFVHAHRHIRSKVCRAMFKGKEAPSCCVHLDGSHFGVEDESFG